jgi:hypothetical protein
MTLDPQTVRNRHTAVLACFAATAVIGCATLGVDRGQPLVPDRVETRTGPFAVYTNSALGPDAPAVRCLGALEGDLAAHLGVRVPAGGPPVEVYILKDREAFSHFLQFYYPELPPRRAFFLAQGPKRMVYAFTNERLEEDIRHEATHAVLHLAVGDLPLWLDEGLAEYFEGPGRRDGLNPEHLARLPDDLKAGWRPDLARLETLTGVREMSPRDYRESWAWVHYFLNGPPATKAALLGYLADLRTDPHRAASLSARLDATDRAGAEHLLAHLERVRAAPAPVASAAPASRPSVLLQDAPLEPSAFARAAGRPTLLGRIFALFGPARRAGPDME